MSRYEPGQGSSFREYQFFAGPLAKKRVRDISDEHLRWAIKFNKEYIETHLNPAAKTRWRGRMVTVGTIPTQVLEQRVGYAEEAIRACELEMSYRQHERDMERATAPRMAVDTLGAAERLVASMREQEGEFRITRQELQSLERLQHNLANAANGLKVVLQAIHSRQGHDS